MKRLGVFLLPLDGVLVHRRVTPSIKSACTHLYTWVERCTVRVKCLAQEHSTMSPARARSQIARSGDERTNHEATAPPKNTFTRSLHSYLLQQTRTRTRLQQTRTIQGRSTISVGADMVHTILGRIEQIVTFALAQLCTMIFGFVMFCIFTFVLWYFGETLVNLLKVYDISLYWIPRF